MHVFVSCHSPNNTFRILIFFLHIFRFFFHFIIYVCYINLLLTKMCLTIFECLYKIFIIYAASEYSDFFAKKNPLLVLVAGKLH